MDTVQDLYTTREGEIMYIIPDRFQPVQAFFNGLEGDAADDSHGVSGCMNENRRLR